MRIVSKPTTSVTRIVNLTRYSQFLGIKPGMHVLDMFSGGGYYSRAHGAGYGRY